MGTKLYVGNLSYSINDESLSSIFAEVGEVASARVIIDRDTGRAKGFGFVEMATEKDAQEAISRINGKTVEGRQITVNEARPQEPRQGGGGGGRSGGFGGGGGGGGGGRGGYRGGR